MATPGQQDSAKLLAQLAKGNAGGDSANPWENLAAQTPAHQGGKSGDDAQLDEMLSRLNAIAAGEKPPAPASPQPKSAPPKPAPAQPSAPQNPPPVNVAPAADAGKASQLVQQTELNDVFVPKEPKTFREAGLTQTEVEHLVLKSLLSRGEASGRFLAEQVKLPFRMIEITLADLKHERLIVLKKSGEMNDYIYELSDMGRERARRLAEHCTYYGSAPVLLKDYIASVGAQTITEQHPTVDDLKRAFADLLINPHMLRRLGPAINSGRGLFLYGAPGNGKTSIAERVTGAFGQHIWIPRAIGVDGEIIRLYDPSNHEEAPLEKSEGLIEQVKVDKRWIRIVRPTIVVGGELTMDNLEVTLNSATGINEAPMQLKSNCGTLVIDDFGRQRMTTDELLNRWIVPLEKRYDFLNLPNGKKIQVPFDQLIIFSTNLEPKDLCDDAFLRRIPYKIEITDPAEAEFRKLFEIMCPKFGFEYQQAPIDYLIETHYKSIGRPFRCCQPRDLLTQVRNLCYYENREPRLTNEFMDFAVENYFAVM